MIPVGLRLAADAACAGGAEWVDRVPLVDAEDDGLGAEVAAVAFEAEVKVRASGVPGSGFAWLSSGGGELLAGEYFLACDDLYCGQVTVGVGHLVHSSYSHDVAAPATATRRVDAFTTVGDRDFAVDHGKDRGSGGGWGVPGGVVVVRFDGVVVGDCGEWGSVASDWCG